VAGDIKLHIVTPTARILSTKVDAVFIPAFNGEMDILPGHTPVLTFLGVGTLKYVKDNTPHQIAVKQGFAEVRDDEVTILTDQAFIPEDVDLEELKKDMADAEQSLIEKDLSDSEWEREQAKLAIARTRKELFEEKK